MPPIRHCRHCWGDCGSTCLLPGELGQQGLCIHKPLPRRPPREWLRVMGTRRFWRGLFLGVR